MIYEAIGRAGFAPRGAVRLEPRELPGEFATAKTLVLVGVTGRRGWEAFAASPEAHDGREDPLDRFSLRVIGGLASRLAAAALYPFGGPPYWPFQQWARRAEGIRASPLGLLIHREFGLWHSYRGALAFGEALDVPAVHAAASPCEACCGRPCLNACPVRAFSAAGYDVDVCAAHLRTPEGAACMDAGCLARRACPVGAAFAHAPDQASFTMRAFLRARSR